MCGVAVEHEVGKQTRATGGQILEEMITANKVQTKLLGYYELLWKISMAQMLRDPSIPEEVKEALQQADDSETAERILRDAGLL